MRFIKSFALVILIGVAMAGIAIKSASAAVLKFSYGGTITRVVQNDAGLLEAAGFGLNSTFTGQFEYDTAEIAVVVIEGTTVNYALISLSLQFDPSHSFVSDSSAGIQIRNTLSSFDSINPFSNGSMTNLSYDNLRVSLALFDFTATVFDDLSLPNTLSFGSFNSTGFLFDGVVLADNTADIYQGNITTLTQLTAIPLPAALPLYGTGLGAIAESW